MLQNPGASGRQTAVQFGVSPVWISIIKNSEVFRVEFERRREALSQTVTAEIADRVAAAAHFPKADVSGKRRCSGVEGVPSPLCPSGWPGRLVRLPSQPD